CMGRILNAISSDLRFAVQTSVGSGPSYYGQDFGWTGEGRAAASARGSSSASGKIHASRALNLNHAAYVIDHQAVLHNEQAVVCCLAPRSPGSYLSRIGGPESAISLVDGPERIYLSLNVKGAACRQRGAYRGGVGHNVKDEFDSDSLGAAGWRIELKNDQGNGQHQHRSCLQ